MAARVFASELTALIKARFPVLYVITWEEKRFIDTVKSMLQDAAFFNKPRAVWEWSVVDGFIKNGKAEKSDVKTSVRALEFIDQVNEDGVFILKDIYSDLSAQRCDQALIRKIKDLV